MPGPLSLLSLSPPAVRIATPCLLLLVAGLAPVDAAAQDEAFLRCDEFNERTARVACLEEALENAVSARDAAQSREAASVTSPAPSAAPVVQQAPPAPAATAPAASTPTTAAAPSTSANDENDSRLLDVFGWFGRDRNDEEETPEVAESMQATVAELSLFKPDVWTITLDNGQVWRQLYADRYNLRAGDKVTITRATGRVQYRLEAERFNGFIRVERLR